MITMLYTSSNVCVTSIIHHAPICHILHTRSICLAVRSFALFGNSYNIPIFLQHLHMCNFISFFDSSGHPSLPLAQAPASKPPCTPAAQAMAAKKLATHTMETTATEDDCPLLGHNMAIHCSGDGCTSWVWIWKTFQLARCQRCQQPWLSSFVDHGCQLRVHDSSRGHTMPVDDWPGGLPPAAHPSASSKSKKRPTEQPMKAMKAMKKSKQG